jgi:uncharacterized protein (UPF0332 family)
MQPEAFLVLAKRLVQEDEEAARRTAISRAYYAAFHKGREMLGSLGFTFSRGPDAHKHVVLYLQQSGNGKVVAAGQKLESLRSIRNKADYDLQTPHVAARQNAELHLKDAQKIMDALDTTKSGPPAEEIKCAIKAYNAKIQPKPETNPPQ